MEVGGQFGLVEVGLGFRGGGAEKEEEEEGGRVGNLPSHILQHQFRAPMIEQQVPVAAVHMDLDPFRQ